MFVCILYIVFDYLLPFGIINDDDDKTGVVVEVRQFDQYVIRVHGSGSHS